MIDRLQDRTVGRWRGLLPELGVPRDFLSGKHGPCPCCGGKDRFRFDDKGGNGTWICNRCGAGNGIDLVMRVNEWDFKQARARILELLPSTVVEMPKARRLHHSGDKRAGLWQRAAPLTGQCPPSRYLINRGLVMDKWPSQIRYLPDHVYYGEGGERSRHPAMISQFIAPDARSATYEFLYLTEDGNKADVDRPRKLAQGSIPKGGAVRLFYSAEVMGVAEGIETALSAHKIDNIPVWATLSAGNLLRFEPPDYVKTLVIYADNDESYCGQAAAFGFAHRLAMKGKNVEVRVPHMTGDYNDMLLFQLKEAAE